MARPEDSTLIRKLLNYRKHPQNIQIVTVKVTVWSAGFGWTGLDSTSLESGLFPFVLN